MDLERIYCRLRIFRFMLGSRIHFLGFGSYGKCTYVRFCHLKLILLIGNPLMFFAILFFDNIAFDFCDDIGVIVYVIIVINNINIVIVVFCLFK